MQPRCLIQVDPAMLNPNMNLGRISFSQQKFEKSKLHFQNVINNIDKDNAEAHLYLAQIAAHEDDLDSALRALQEAIHDGYKNKEALMANPYLENLHKLPGFKEMMKGLE